MYRWVSSRPTMAGFVAVYYGNTGSSWLLSALDGSPRVHVPGFEPVEEWAWDAPAEERLGWLETTLDPPSDRSGEAYRAWLDALRASPQVKDDPVDTGFDLTGLKLCNLAVTNPDEVVDIIDRTGSKAILLSRQNRLKHALSMYRYHDENKSQFHGKDVYAPTSVDFRRFKDWLLESHRLLDLATQFYDACERTLGADRTFRLSYEEFTDDAGKDDVLGRLASFLGIPAAFGEGIYAKATPDSLAAAVANYRALWMRYRFGRHAAFLD